MTRSHESQIENLASRQAILDAILRCARGFDRCDNALIASAFHPDASINYGAAFQGGVAQMVRWADELHRGLGATYHQLANHYVEFDEDDPDAAHGETYVIGSWRTADQDITGLARYVDRFERRDGEWRISERLCVLDIAKVENRGPAFEGPLAQGPVVGHRSPEDPSYTMFERGRRAHRIG